MTGHSRIRRPTLAEIERNPDFRALMAMTEQEIAKLDRMEDDDPEREERTGWDRIRTDGPRRS